MDGALWARARELFEEAAELPEDERQAFLARLGEDSGLRSAVEDLLKADAGAEGLLDATAGPWMAHLLLEAGEAAWLGRRLGPYRIVTVLGRGGMGTVFGAVRDDASFEKSVAIKVMRSSLAGAEARRRFQQERQILATLDHPSIARLLDGGETEEGVPWLAMERVDGRPLVAWCDEQRLPVAARVRLLAEVCDAVTHAHRHLVVHRDIKPSNVLVDAQSRPCLVDFGVAKLLDAAPAEDLTSHLKPMLTPNYASPEQVAGGAVSTATDVYSLGVLLYELLTGRPAFSWTGLTLEQVRLRLEQEPPVPPSRALPEGADAASLRATSRAELRRLVSGDLDRIVMMALRPAASERYPSADALADDLRRWLGGFPVRASGISRWYRARTFARRNRWALAGVTLAAAALVAFSAVAVVQARQADRQRRRAEAVTAMLVGAFADADPERNRGEVATAREILDSGARRLLADASAEPAVAAELARTVGSVYVSLGLYEQAAPQLARASAAVASGGVDDATHAAIEESLAELRLGQGLITQASEHARRAVEIHQRSGRSAEALVAERLFARVERAAGRRGEAVAVLERVLAAQEQRFGAGSEPALRTRLELAQTEADRGDAARAEGLLQTARGLRDPASPLGVSIDGELANVLLRRGRPKEAEPLARAALQSSRRIWGERHPKVAEAVTLMGGIDWELGRPGEAQEAFRVALQMRRELLGPHHPKLASSLYNVAFALHRRFARPDLAEPVYREAVEVFKAFERSLGPVHPSAGIYLRGWGRALTDTGRAAEAEPVLRRALDIFEHHAAGHDARADIASAQSDLADALAHLGRREEALVLLRRAHPVLVEEHGAEHRIARRAAERLAGLESKPGAPPGER